MHVRTKSRWTSERAESPRGQKIERKDGSVVAVVEALCVKAAEEIHGNCSFLVWTERSENETGVFFVWWRWLLQ